ncbi:hypothetical protein PSTG_03550 [Puccinia striiformis f. sp. tritici PST-78]|uniref:Uncharacterized protein n=1 Tax=Puccinia striiformis f. sp. tritici PST-78 TaxID=1165861 RepID=A0A0L0VW94_9BASI|nr:hypothetical protein PSTG_03550 [Puccinia striiformis f. sp. tritici PST-78]
MVNLSKKWLHSLCLHGLTIGKFAFASPYVEGPAQDSVRMVQSVEHPTSNDAVVINTPTRPQIQHEQVLRCGPEANKGEALTVSYRIAKIASLKEESEKIRLWIQMLDTRSKKEFLEIQYQLEQLLHGLKPSILERVRRLSGLGPSLATVQFKLDTESKEGDVISSLKPAAARITNDKHRPNAGIDSRSGLSRSMAALHLDADTGREGLTSTGNSAKKQKDNRRYEFYDDILGVLKERMLHKEMTIWNSLQTSLIGFQARNHLVKTDAKFLLGFLKILYRLRDLIHEYRLMPTNFINNLEISKPQTLFNMVEYYIELSFSKWQGKFFEIPGSLIPQLEFLTTRLSAKHFSRSINDLGAKHQRDIVYLVLTSILRHEPCDSPDSSQSFTRIREEILHGDFLGEVDRLSSASKRSELGIDVLADIQNHRIVGLIKSMVHLFQNPSRMSIGRTERLHYQLVFYIIDFIEKYYQPIFNKIVSEGGTSVLFEKQLKYMRAYLKSFQTSFEDWNYFMKPESDKTFQTMTRTSLHEDPSLHHWITTITHYKFKHNDLIRGVMYTYPRLSHWMGGTCWKCDSRYWCGPACHLFFTPEDFENLLFAY